MSKGNNKFYTNQNKDEMQSQDFELKGDFVDNFAKVRLKDGSWAFVDKNYKICSDRFFYAFSFKDGLAKVRFNDMSWGFIDNKLNICQERFKYLSNFENGLAFGILKNGEKCYIDRKKHIFSVKEGKLLQSIYKNPTKFLTLPTKMFNDERFIESALLQVKDGLIEFIKKKKQINDECVEFCDNILNSCRSKLKREQNKIKESKMRGALEQERKSDLVRNIQEFKL